MFQVTNENKRAEYDDIVNEMYRARRRLFVDQLGWNIPVDDEGRQIDRFDGPSSIYVIDMDDRGRHRGSVRLLPMTGDTVLSDRMGDVLDGESISSPSVWEYSRFCVIGDEENPFDRAGAERVAVDLMLAMCETCIAAGVGHVIGSMGRRMNEMYRRNGWSPDLLGQSGRGAKTAYLGLLETVPRSADALRAAGGLSGSSIVRTSAPFNPP